VKAYKLVRLKKNGAITPLFINKKLEIEFGVWYKAEDHKTKGFAHRPGWHCTLKPKAPHLNMELSSGEKRVWVECEIEDFQYFNRPESQGGAWVLADKIKFVGFL